VPAKPAWYSKLTHIIEELRSSPRPFIDRATVELLLGVGRRRAQQIMAPYTTERIGTNGLVDRDALIVHLRQLAEGDDGLYEAQRRRKLAEVLDTCRKDYLEQPRLLIEAPVQVMNQEFDDLPPGVHIETGRIIVEFDQPQQALEKLLALAMAISNDFERFERQVRTPAGKGEDL
jgi:hypothetical protein